MLCSGEVLIGGFAATHLINVVTHNLLVRVALGMIQRLFLLVLSRPFKTTLTLFGSQSPK